MKIPPFNILVFIACGVLWYGIYLSLPILRDFVLGLVKVFAVLSGVA
jgi:hypothetical protein